MTEWGAVLKWKLALLCAIVRRLSAIHVIE
ncbi:MAG: hypothetical protein ACJAZ0_001045 [Halioglobus sp.]|jgi:hypothetical protein